MSSELSRAMVTIGPMDDTMQGRMVDTAWQSDSPSEGRSCLRARRTWSYSPAWAM